MSAADAARHRALLDARSATLAARGLDLRQEVARRGFLVCALGAERFGLPVETVAAVLPDRPCTPLPGAGGALRGIIAHAGEIVTVIDPARLLGLARDEGAPDPAQAREPRHLVRLRAEPPTALLVDRVLGLASLASDRIEPPQGAPAGPGTDGVSGGLGAAAVSGYATADPENGASDGFAVLDPKRLLAPLLP